MHGAPNGSRASGSRAPRSLRHGSHSVPKAHRPRGATRSRKGCAVSASGAGNSPDEQNEVPAAAPPLRVKKEASPAATLSLRAKNRTCQRHNSCFVSRSAAAGGTTPSRNRERLAPAAQPDLGEKKSPAPRAQPLLGEEKLNSFRRKPFSERLAGRCTCHDLFSTRKRGCASGKTPFSSRDRVAPVAQPVLRIEKELRRWRRKLFLPGKGSRQSEIANLDTENEFSRRKTRSRFREGGSPLRTTSSRHGNRVFPLARVLPETEKALSESHAAISTRKRVVRLAPVVFHEEDDARSARYRRLRSRNCCGSPKRWPPCSRPPESTDRRSRSPATATPAQLLASLRVSVATIESTLKELWPEKSEATFALGLRENDLEGLARRAAARLRLPLRSLPLRRLRLRRLTPAAQPPAVQSGRRRKAERQGTGGGGGCRRSANRLILGRRAGPLSRSGGRLTSALATAACKLLEPRARPSRLYRGGTV